MKKFVIGILCFMLLQNILIAQISPQLRTTIDSMAGEHLKSTGGIGFVVAVYNKGEKDLLYYGITFPGGRDRAA